MRCACQPADSENAKLPDTRIQRAVVANPTAYGAHSLGSTGAMHQLPVQGNRAL